MAGLGFRGLYRIWGRGCGGLRSGNGRRRRRATRRGSSPAGPPIAEEEVGQRVDRVGSRAAPPTRLGRAHYDYVEEPQPLVRLVAPHAAPAGARGGGGGVGFPVDPARALLRARVSAAAAAFVGSYFGGSGVALQSRLPRPGNAVCSQVRRQPRPKRKKKRGPPGFPGPAARPPQRASPTPLGSSNHVGNPPLAGPSPWTPPPPELMPRMFTPPQTLTPLGSS